MILPLSAATFEGVVGPKAATLARLRIAGLEVPDGFVVSCDAFRAHVCRGGIDHEIRSILASAELLDAASVGDACQRCRRLVESSPLESQFTEQLLAARRELGGPVAVRSSSNIEDLGTASFAGLYDSRLNVDSDADLFAAIKACWSSLWTARAVLYRARLGIADDDAAMAVIVQRMVPATTAGVAFTEHPITGATNEVVIDAVHGLGEAAVSGLTTPETITVSKDAGVPPQRSSAGAPLVLNDAEADAVAEVAQTVERLLGHRCDVEWAIADSLVHLLQARPVTRRTERIERPAPDGWLHRRLMDVLLGYFPEPPYPFDRSVLLGLLQSFNDFAAVAGLRAVAAERVLELTVDGRMRLNPLLPRPAWRALRVAPVAALRFLAGLRVDPQQAWDSRWHELEARLRELEGRPVDALDDADLVTLIEEAVAFRDEQLHGSRLVYIPATGIWIAVLPALLKLFRVPNRADVLSTLSVGLDIPTSLMNRELRVLADEARREPDVAAVLASEDWDRALERLHSKASCSEFCRRLDTFIARHGARTTSLLPAPSIAAWEDEPEQLLRLIWLTGQAPAPDLRGTLVPPRLGRVAKVVGGRLIALAVARNRQIITERDRVIVAFERAARPLRRAMRELGERLERQGLLAAAPDVRFLGVDEIAAALGGHRSAEHIGRIVRTRKGGRIAAQAAWRPQPRRSSVSNDMMLRGYAANGGSSLGPAAVITSERQFVNLKPGDVLVCPATTPAWTPLFSIAAAVVADTGGILSHAAIVAREYGIPAVLATGTATTQIADGELCVVDGTCGTVSWERS